MSSSAIILAAGKGTRMRSDLTKVLHRAAGRTLLDWVLAAVEPLHLDHVAVVVGEQADDVTALLPPWATAACQAQQLGTADAARVGLDALPGVEGTLLVLPGDMPLLSSVTLQRLIEAHDDSGAAATVLTVRVADPSGYGRIIRDGAGGLIGIVEDRDADTAQAGIDEINTSVYAFDTQLLDAALAKVGTDNTQGEYYLTDVIAILGDEGHPLAAVEAPEQEGLGVNSNEQLAAVSAALRAGINARHMEAGVWMLDPSRVYIDSDVTIGAGSRIYPDTILEEGTTVGDGAEIGPSVHAKRSAIASGARVRFAVLDGARIGPRADVGPFTYLRPGADLREDSKAGTFVEIKKSVVGARSKVPHLSYIGDATIGEDTNIGAATVTVNYDGFEKHRTVIGDRVRIGSDTMLVAPVEVGDDAYTGAGSVITSDVPPGALAIERSPQKEVPGYAEKRRRRAGVDER
jgi:bifunctional UDP-N-acetylglucosamine pyrophosphorylase / glucosamine-1-phosphate N-acetyltransferase